MRVIVVGAGIVGASVAERFASRGGVTLTVLERDAPASGTSGATFAWVNSNGKTPPVYHELNVAGMSEFVRRRNQLNDVYRSVGHLEIATDQALAQRLAARAADLTAVGYRAEPITVDRLRQLEPALTLPVTPALIMHFPDEGYCDADRLVHRLLDVVRSRGGVVRNHARVIDLHSGSDEVTIHLAGGERLTADRVVLCLGRWMSNLTGQIGARIPMQASSRTGALLAITAALDRRPVRVISTPKLNLRPYHRRQLMLQSLDLDRKPAGPEAARDFARRGRVLLPGLRVASVLATRRVIPADGMSAVGWLNARTSVYAIATHSGVTLSLLLGRLAADEVLDGADSPLLAPFRPARFITYSTGSNPSAS